MPPSRWRRWSGRGDKQVETDALSARLRALFLEELDEHVDALNRGLVAAEQVAGRLPAEALQMLFRSAHSLKGAAAAVGSTDVEAVCHRMEDGLQQVRDGRTPLTPALLSRLFASVDAIATEGTRLRAVPGGDPSPAEDGEPSPAGAVAVGRFGAEAGPSAGQPAMAAGPPTAAEGPVLRVPVAKFDALLAQAGVLTAASRRVEGLGLRLEQVRAGVDRGSAVAAALDELARHAGAAERGLRQAGDGFAEAVRFARLLPFGRACEGLDRIVRDLAHGLGKQARVVVEGAGAELDRAVLEAVRDPLLHLVRNAISHGIERPAERERVGKPAVGTVRVEAVVRGRGVVVTVSDDGAGADADAVRAAAARRGLPEPSTPAELIEALFAPGLSTALEPTALAGRGVGLDAVRSQVEAIGGEVRATSGPGVGTSVVLTLPLSISAVQVLVAQVAGETVALTASGTPCRIRPDEPALRAGEGRAALVREDGVAPLVPLAAVLGFAADAPAVTGVVHAMVAGSPGSAVALVVDRLLTEQEVLVRPLGDRLAQLPGVLGGAVLADGRPVLVLNTAVCARLALAEVGWSGRAHPAVPPRQRVLLADDSLTTRTLEQSMLEAAGYEVSLAGDGAAAWALLRERGADAVVADVDMPIMTGLDLCRAIRTSERFVDLPVLLVTSLETDEDRRQGLLAGADAYLVKSRFDPAALLESLGRLL